jgi:hypothetical protein
LTKLVRLSIIMANKGVREDCSMERSEAEKAAEKAGIEKPVCTGCGEDLAEGVKFCSQCGTPAAAEPVEGTVE